jgi:serine/threonine-protein kinase HipA
MTATLDVYFESDLVGRVHDTQPLSFEYAASWLERPNAHQIASIEMRAGVNNSSFVLAFFDNLLPEGALREYVSQKFKASTVFSLLNAIAGDTAGGLVILPPGQVPEPPGYEQTTWEKLAAIVREGSGTLAAEAKVKGARISLSGAQDKALICVEASGMPSLPTGSSPSTHILKPNIRRMEGVWESAANEALVMRMAKKCGLDVSEVFYEPTTRACIVRRYDRVEAADGTLRRLVQYDLCQLNGTASGKKYESEGGPGIARCLELVRKYSSVPAADLNSVLKAVFFNLCAGNNDGHAKNLSLLARVDKSVRLAPLYDLMCTRIYPGLSGDFAFQIGGEARPGSISRTHVEALAREIKMRPAFVLGVARQVGEQVLEAAPQALVELQPDLPHSAAILGERVVDRVREITRGLVQRLA